MSSIFLCKSVSRTHGLGCAAGGTGCAAGGTGCAAGGTGCAAGGTGSAGSGAGCTGPRRQNAMCSMLFITHVSVKCFCFLDMSVRVEQKIAAC